MESSPSAMLKFLLPKTPFILKTALAHTLSLSDTASKWDLRTELTVKILRDMLGPHQKPQPITKMQRLTTRDPGVKGKIWVSKVALEAPPEDDVRQAVFRAVEEMGDGSEVWEKCEMGGVQGEWHGFRAGVTDTEPEPSGLSEKDKYDRLMGEVQAKTTTLYFHGGAMYLLDPASYRFATGRIARETKGRVFSVRYRLAPQAAFPAAILDALAAYLSLLHPPPGAPHAAVPANEIVFAGDSAGGLLSAALLQLLLQLHRTHKVSGAPGLPTLRWHGAAVEIPLPAGVALSSPWLDITRSLPSLSSLAKYDYLPPPSHTASPRFPPDTAWPATPPRADLYCDAATLLHPLVSPVLARDWAGAPPVLFAVGEEMLRDEGAVLARQIAAQGGVVRWREWEAMPHCFAYVLDFHPAAGEFFDEFCGFCGEVVEGKVVRSDGEKRAARTLAREVVGVESLTALGDEEVARFMREGRERIEKGHAAVSVEAKSRL